MDALVRPPFSSSILVTVVLCLGALCGLLGIALSTSLEYFLALLQTVLYLLLGLLLIKRYFQGKENSFLLRLFLAGFALRLAFALSIHLSNPPFGLVYVDEEYYFARSLTLARLWAAKGIAVNYIQLAGSGNYGYLIFNAIHYLLYASPLLPKITNVFLGSLLPIAVFRLAKELLNRRAAVVSSLIAFCTPDLIYWSAFNFKEILVAFLVILSFTEYLLLKGGAQVRRLMIVILGIILLLTIRFYVGILLLGLIVIHIIATMQFAGKVKAFTLLFLAICLSIYFITNPFVPTFLAALDPERLSAEIRSSFEKTREKGYFMGEFSPSNPITYLLSAAHFLVTPSVYRFRISVKGFLNMGTIVWLVLMPFFFIGSYDLLKKKQALPILGFVWASIIFYSFLPFLGMVRHRAQLLPLMIVIAGNGIHTRFKHKRGIVAGMWILLFAGMGLAELLF